MLTVLAFAVKLTGRTRPVRHEPLTIYRVDPTRRDEQVAS